MLNLSFCNYHSNLNKDIEVKASLEDNYYQYVIQLDKKVNLIYGLPSISSNNNDKIDKKVPSFKSYPRYLKRRDNIKVLFVTLQDYDDIRIPHENFQGINLLSIDYNDEDYRKVYDTYHNLLFFMYSVAKRSDHSMSEWSALLNETWYQVHLLHDIVIEDKFNTESLILIIDKMIDGLSNKNNYLDYLSSPLTTIGKEHVKVTICKLRRLREWLSLDLQKYGVMNYNAHNTYSAYRQSNRNLYRQRDRNLHEKHVVWENKIPWILLTICAFYMFPKMVFLILLLLIVFLILLIRLTV